MIRLAALTLLTAAVVGCGALEPPVFLGPKYAPREAASGSSIIYIYRQPQLRFRGIPMPVFVDDDEVGSFYAGGYVPFRAAPGRHEVKLLLGSAAPVAVETQPGVAVFVRLTIAQIFDDSTIERVPAAEAAEEIAACRLLPGGYDNSDAF